MKPTILQQIDLWIKTKYAFAMCLICLILNLLPTQTNYFNIKPDLVLASIYFWAIYKPEDIGLGKAFILGLFVDLLEGSLLGVNTLLFLLTFIITSNLRRFVMGKAFIISFWGISLIGLGVFIVKWFLISLNLNAFVNINVVLASYILTILFYPAIGLIGAKVYSASLKD